ncbi:MAG: hypothetical protein AB1384_13270 [Actinomycetota bacterium]
MNAKLCSGCGAPRRITREHTWLNNGLIVETRNPERRMLFFESDNIVELFANIEEIVGHDIDRIITESQHMTTFDYVVNLVPGVVRRIVRYAGLKMLAKNLIGLTRVMGLGDAELESVKFKGGDDDHVAVVVRNPWFLQCFSGQISGGMEAVTGLESQATYEELAPDTYRITTHISSHPKEITELLKERKRVPKQGHLDLPRCAICGGPQDLDQFEWNVAEGTIETRANRRRMVLAGPGEFEPIFEVLEQELGEHIPKVVIEAERRFVTEGFYSRDDIRQEKDLVRHFALRGLGNLREIRLEKNRLLGRLENPCMNLVIVGLFLGFYELIFGQPGDVAWEVAPDGDLTIDINAAI